MSDVAARFGIFQASVASLTLHDTASFPSLGPLDVQIDLHDQQSIHGVTSK